MNNLRKVIEEISTGSKNERLTRAIKNRMPVSFIIMDQKVKFYQEGGLKQSLLLLD